MRGSNSIEGISVTEDQALAIVSNEEDQVSIDATWLAVRSYSDAVTYLQILAARSASLSEADLLAQSLHSARVVKRLPAALQYDPSRFRQAVKEMGEQERAALRSEIRRELRLIQNGRLSAEARADASAQARFLLATLSGKAVPIPHARKRPSKLTSTTKTQWHADEDPEATPTPRFRSVRTYGPSPSKYLLPAYGAPVSGGLPSLGRRS